jgi:hypothetical protein
MFRWILQTSPNFTRFFICSTRISKSPHDPCRPPAMLLRLLDEEISPWILTEFSWSPLSLITSTLIFLCLFWKTSLYY